MTLEEWNPLHGTATAVLKTRSKGRYVEDLEGLATELTLTYLEYPKRDGTSVYSLMYELSRRLRIHGTTTPDVHEDTCGGTEAASSIAAHPLLSLIERRYLYFMVGQLYALSVRAEGDVSRVNGTLGKIIKPRSVRCAPSGLHCGVAPPREWISGRLRKIGLEPLEEYALMEMGIAPADAPSFFGDYGLPMGRFVGNVSMWWGYG